MMTRNTERRVEIAAPVLNPVLRKQVLSMVHDMLTDNVKARRLMTDGRYVLRRPTDDYVMNSQEHFIKTAERLATGAMLKPEETAAQQEPEKQPDAPKPAVKVTVKRILKK